VRHQSERFEAGIPAHPGRVGLRTVVMYLIGVGLYSVFIKPLNLMAGTVARLGVRRPVGYFRVCSLAEGGCVAWMVRLYQTPYPVTALAQVRCVIEARRSGVFISLFQAAQQASTMAP